MQRFLIIPRKPPFGPIPGHFEHNFLKTRFFEKNIYIYQVNFMNVWYMSSIFKEIYRNRKNYYSRAFTIVYHIQPIISDFVFKVSASLRKIKKKNKMFIFECSFIWYHILCCLLDSNSFDTLFKCFLRIELADHFKSLAYLSRFRKQDSV